MADMTASSSQGGVFPEHRLRDEVVRRGGSLELPVGQLALDFGVRRVSAAALSNIESSLATERIAVSPSPMPADPGASVTLSHQEELESPKESDPELSPRRWELTAPESHVLLYLQAGARDAFKLAVTELVARGALHYRRVEKKRMPGWTIRRALLCDGPRKYAVTQPALLSVLELSDAMATRSFVPGGNVTVEGGLGVVGVPVERLARAAAKQRRNYHDECIVPLLVDRGLLRFRGSKHTVSNARKAIRTAEGVDARDELDSLLKHGSDHLRALLEGDPSRALEYARATWPAVLLMDDLPSELASLSQQAPLGGSKLDLGALAHLDLSVFDYFNGVGSMAGPTPGGG